MHLGRTEIYFASSGSSSSPLFPLESKLLNLELSVFLFDVHSHCHIIMTITGVSALSADMYMLSAIHLASHLSKTPRRYIVNVDYR